MIDIIIDEQAETIKRKIKDGKIYGLTVDMNNISQVIVAAYYLGKAEELGLHIDQQEKLRELTSR